MKKIVMKPWGMEIWIVNTDLYCYKMMLCVHHKWSSGGKYHYHPIKDETFIIVRGKLILDIDEKINIVYPKQIIRVKPNIPHRFRSFGNSCVFYEVSTHHSENDSIRL
jgi:mannose-6-phosphate isomerase-like protein (cupin superfamily)